MRLRSAAAVAIAAFGCGASEPQPVAAPPAGEAPPPAGASAIDPKARLVIDARRVLWIGAHPDDETVVAPLLAHVCGVNGTTCTFVVLTRGEDGGCRLPDGCKPDLATVRDAELRASAALFGATLRAWDLGDVQGTPDDVLRAWSAESGSVDDLVGGIADEIAAARPDVLLAFDPRHGVTCHPAHRTAGDLALRAAEQAGVTKDRILLATAEWIVEGTDDVFGFLPYARDDARVLRWDATRPLPSRDGTGWDWLVKVLDAHPSQFFGFRDAALAAPPAMRIVPLLAATDHAPDDARYRCRP